MLVICLGMTLVAAITTFFYKFKRINYTKLARNTDQQSIELNSSKQYFTPHAKRSEITFKDKE